MALVDKYDVHIWDNSLAERIISYLINETQDINEKSTVNKYYPFWHHSYCSVMNSYRNLINTHNPDEIIFKNLDNVVVDCSNVHGCIFMKYIHLRDSIFRLKDVKMIWNSMSKFRDNEVRMEYCYIDDYKVDGLTTRVLTISFYVTNDFFRYKDSSRFDFTKLFVPKRPDTVYQFAPNDFRVDQSMDNTYNNLVRDGIPRYFLDHLIANGQILKFI